MKTVILLASARSEGNTAKLASVLVDKLGADLVDLKQYHILPYNYEGDYNDDFIGIIEKIVKEYETIIFATPVYWYAMSALLKNFFDRFTDLITFRKDLGRDMVGKGVYVVTTSNGNHLEEQFWLPFFKTSEYLKMDFKGGCHFENSINYDIQLKVFLDKNDFH